MADPCDIAVVGAGPVGMLCAVLAADAGFSVTIIEASATAPRIRDEPDLRTYALTVASTRILDHAGVWPVIAGERIGPVTDMMIRDAGGSGRICFSAADIGVAALCYIVEHQLLAVALAQRLAGRPSLRWQRDDTVIGCEWRPGDRERLMHLNCASGRTVPARVVIGADGADSALRRLLDIDTCTASYEQQGVVANVRFEHAHRQCARQRFLPTGPLALLPLMDPQTCSIVWSTTDAEQLCAGDQQAFAAALTDACEGVLGEVLSSSARAAFPLRRQHLNDYVRDGVAFVGDAAHVVHPLAGQGLNLGLLDAAALIEVLVDAAGSGRPIGARSTLRRYERWRKGENLLMEWTMDGFHRLFTADQTALVRARNLGLSLANASGPLKHTLMRRAMGLTGDLPRAACRRTAR